MAARRHQPATGTARVREIQDRRIAVLDSALSAALPSRGQVAVHVEVAGHDDPASAQTVIVVEPDGRKGHWLRLEELPIPATTSEGTELELTLTPAASWPEPQVPADLAAALEQAPDAAGPWADITPMARWEWVRWVGATRSASTRARRVDVSIDKLRTGSRRPCCFDLSSCTDPELARSGRLPD